MRGAQPDVLERLRPDRARGARGPARPRAARRDARSRTRRRHSRSTRSTRSSAELLDAYRDLLPESLREREGRETPPSSSPTAIDAAEHEGPAVVVAIDGRERSRQEHARGRARAAARRRRDRRGRRLLPPPQREHPRGTDADRGSRPAVRLGAAAGRGAGAPPARRGGALPPLRLGGRAPRRGRRDRRGRGRRGGRGRATWRGPRCAATTT